MTLQETINEVFAKHDAECLLLTKQRDEARREACEYATCTHPTVGNSPRALALDKGWDCYKDETQ